MLGNEKVKEKIKLMINIMNFRKCNINNLNQNYQSFFSKIYCDSIKMPQDVEMNNNNNFHHTFFS